MALGLPTRAIGFMSQLLLGQAQGYGGTGNTTTMVSFGVKTAQIKTSSDEFEVGDTNSGPFKRHQPGRFMFQGNFTAYIDTSVQTFSTGAYGAVIGSAIWLNFYPSGIKTANNFTPTPNIPGAVELISSLPGGGGNDPYICPNFVVFNANLNCDVGQPVTLEFDGKCDNAFAAPNATG